MVHGTSGKARRGELRGWAAREYRTGGTESTGHHTMNLGNCNEL